jgi:hypothetical protein
MRRDLLLILAFALTAVCGNEATVPAGEIALQVEAGAEEVELGKAFPLTVVRVWSRDLAPGVWNDRQLAPLTVRLVETTRREDKHRIEETRLYLCYAFSLGDITIPAPVFKARPRDGGPERTARAGEIVLLVKGLLDPEAPGEAELPGGPLPEPFPWLPWSLGGAAAVAALFLLVRSLRRRARRKRALQPAAVTAPEAPAIPPHLRALERLKRLRARHPEDEEAVDAYYVEASTLMREYVGERFSLRVWERTTDELLAASRTAGAVGAPHRTLLGEYLGGCDRVKYGRHMPGAPERERLLDNAARIIEETRTGSEPAAERSGP